MRRQSLLLPLVCLLAISGMGMNLADTFPGKWKIHLVPDDDSRNAKLKEGDDTIVFTPTTFTVEKFFPAHKLQPVRYEEDTRRMGPATFTAEAKSDAEGTFKWTGTITATAIKGALAWTQKDGTVVTCNYTGEKQTN